MTAGHTRTCFARALICAVENVRDADSYAEFADMATFDYAAEATRYLTEGYLTCSCRPAEGSSELAGLRAQWLAALAARRKNSTDAAYICEGNARDRYVDACTYAGVAPDLEVPA